MSKSIKVDVNCDYCGKKYSVHKSVYDKRKRHFCSRECYSQYRSKMLSTSEQNAFRGNNILASCDFCGKEYPIFNSVYAKTKRHFCSRECYSQYRSKKLPHEEQNAYGRGHTSEEREYRKNARTIWNHYCRDNHIKKQPCEVCGYHKAEAHHDDYNKPLDIRWLCIKCHREWHKIHE